MKSQGKVWVFYDSELKQQTKPLNVVQAQMALLKMKVKDLPRIYIWTPGWTQWQRLSEFLKTEQTYFVFTEPPKPGKGHNSGSMAKPYDLNENRKYQDDVTLVIEQEPPIADDIALTATDAAGYTKVQDGQPLSPMEYGYYHDFNGDDITLSNIPSPKGPIKLPEEKNKSGSDRRRDPRHEFKLEIILVSKYRSFRTYSHNISLSGTMLEDEIPKDFLNKPFDLLIVNRFEPDPRKGRLLFKARIVGDMQDPRRLMFIEQDPQMTAKLEALLKAYATYQQQMRKKVG